MDAARNDEDFASIPKPNREEEDAFGSGIGRLASKTA
jgi:hypothetical protein